MAKCFFFFHDWEIIKILDGYHTVHTWDNPGDMGTDYHTVFLEQCRKCGKRKLSATGKHSSHHSGIKARRKEWVQNGT